MLLDSNSIVLFMAIADLLSSSLAQLYKAIHYVVFVLVGVVIVVVTGVGVEDKT